VSKRVRSTIDRHVCGRRRRSRAGCCGAPAVTRARTPLARRPRQWHGGRRRRCPLRRAAIEDGTRTDPPRAPSKPCGRCQTRARPATRPAARKQGPPAWPAARPPDATRPLTPHSSTRGRVGGRERITHVLSRSLPKRNTSTSTKTAAAWRTRQGGCVPCPLSPPPPPRRCPRSALAMVGAQMAVRHHVRRLLPAGGATPHPHQPLVHR